MKVLIATEKPFAPVAVEGIKKEVEAAGYELALLEKYTDKTQLLEAVADADAETDAVAFAMIRSTFWETKLLAMVAQVAESPAAFCSSKLTLSLPSSFSIASLNPSVAASSAGCCTS